MENNYDENKRKGWISLYRSLSDNPLWTKEPFTRGQAWVDLLMLAQIKDGYFFKRDVIINYKKGDVTLSQLNLAERWKWSRTKVENFLKLLEIEQQIIIHKSKVTTTLTIINFDKYQSKEQQESNRKATEKQQESNRKAHINKIINKQDNKEVVVEDNTTTTTTDEFELMWNDIKYAYPKRTKLTVAYKDYLNLSDEDKRKAHNSITVDLYKEWMQYKEEARTKIQYNHFPTLSFYLSNDIYNEDQVFYLNRWVKLWKEQSPDDYNELITNNKTN